jgi:hypothetical protein
MPEQYSVDDRKRRWGEFLSGERGPGHVYMVHHDPGAPARPLPWPTLVAERTDWAWQSYERQMARAEWLRDDTVPYLNVYTGTEIFAEAFGCDVYRAADNMPFALPLVENARDASRLSVPDPSATPLATLFDIADELRERAGPDAVMRLVDIQSPMDIAALIWDKNDFYAAMLNEPQAVKDLAHKVCDLLKAFLDEWFHRYGEDFVAHHPDYYMPRGVTLSEDEVGAVSEATFVELFEPELIELSRRYGGLGMHSCADARHQWDRFAELPDLRLLNLGQPPGELRDAYDRFAGETTQMHGWTGNGTPVENVAALPEGSRVVIQASASTREEAVELAERLHVACGRPDV